MKRFNLLVSFIIIFILGLSIYSCEKESRIKQNSSVNGEVELRRGWGAVVADVWGLANGIATGAYYGGHLGPNGAVIGGMLGGVAGCVYGSYTYGCKTNTIQIYVDSLVPMAPANGNTINNPYDYIGVLHNQLLNKYLKSSISSSATGHENPEILNALITDVLTELDGDEFNFDPNSFDLEEFRNNFVSNFVSNENLDYERSIISILRDFNNEDIDNSTELEAFVTGKLANNLSKEELIGIAVLRYSFYYWQ